MKKLTIVLFFLGIALISNPVYSADMQDYGKIWRAWGKDGQTAYIWGFIDGQSYTFLTVMSEIIASDKKGDKVPKSFDKNIRLKTAILYDENKIIDIITNLYKDPANSYVWFQDMVYIARDSLSGKDVTKAILEARKAAIANYELNKKMEGK
jgi:hypothetical protein